ncbi:putative dEAD/DEAH box helicase domain-containing protein [Mycobacterium kansasii]|uniref:Putative dEAD/DEAH box helicase domain-containing protein n=1 Tax=Mycobacterium kansasii TaxID=1768 RepID=A0A1V3WJM3_MYCKA|nr:putative dEAD/DEAH box helicase domain-containing protein [Mycobacterium kansasii]
MDAFGVLDEVLNDYESFVKGFLDIKDEQIRAKVEGEIDDGLLWPEPWLALNPAFEPGGSVGELVERECCIPKLRRSSASRPTTTLSAGKSPSIGTRATPSRSPTAANRTF